MANCTPKYPLVRYEATYTLGNCKSLNHSSHSKEAPTPSYTCVAIDLVMRLIRINAHLF